ncbi:MAG: hypothetical protein NC225_02150 [Clostridium sp.]|nr:hypothetical protein [Clostridium sp.]MCM1398265.1 hypothetical protein [Clostridium sp.]MCM1459071.1 hypothetical protein [Bacteroides sp.]
MKPYDERLKQYKNSLRSAWGYNDYNDWPIKINSVMHLFLKEFATECLEDIREIKGNRILENKLIEEFGNPARIYRMIDPVIFGMKRLNIPLERQRKIVIYMLDLVKRMKYGSEFNEDGRNIILSPNQLTRLVNDFTFEQVSGKDAAKIQRFCGAMWAYTEALFFRAHEVTKEIHGPYRLQGDSKLVIREYLNLAPRQIWGDKLPFLNAHMIQIFTIYDKNLDIKIDSYNHLFLNQGDYVSNMLMYMILVDGRQMDINTLMEFMPVIPKTIAASHQWVEETTWRDHTNKYMDIYWFRKKPFRTVLGKTDTVDEAVRANVMHGDVDKRRIHNLSEKQIDRMIQIVI